ncbi:hypothetical protein HYX10_01420 [Candidatus Woesearchaeota archaeon]|nr:hypothetical protein [Candidatus Woesearchaeota archaeon]
MAKGGYNKRAVASALIGLFSLVPVQLLNLALGAVAIGLGVSALKNMQRRKGKTLAAAGIILGTLPYYGGLFYLARIYLKYTPETILTAWIAGLAAPVAVVIAILKSKKLL